MARLITRRILLGWLGGLAGVLAASAADAAPKRFKAKNGVYSDTYSDVY